MQSGPALLDWFDARDRDIPWRNETDPFAILLAEIMAQQTRIETVTPYYERFRQRFPHVEALAAASEEEVLKMWEGLGYYARARNLRRAAQKIVERHEGRVPASIDELRGLPGVGPYTAGAVGSIAFGIAEPAIDGNARRVLSRLFDLEKPTPALLERFARELLLEVPDRPGSMNQAIMDLGSAICTPRRPGCEDCPLAAACCALRNDTVGERPPSKTTRERPTRYAAAAVVRDGDTVLVYRRPSEGLLGGLWDFPHVHHDPEAIVGETLSGGILRDFGLELSLGKQIETVRHVFSHFTLVLTVHMATRKADGDAWGENWLWAGPEQLRDLAFPSYHRQLITERVLPLLS